MMLHADLADIVLRLALALAIGATIGCQRHLNGEAAGLRTHALVALAAALAILIVAPLLGGSADADAHSRVVQGILTGVGFLGAGVIMHGARRRTIHGLTSAAAIWITAVFGALCGSGRLAVALIGFAMVGLVLLIGGPIESALEKFAPRKGE